MIKVGFIINFKKNSWLGGYNYFKNLFECIYSNPERKIDCILIFNSRFKNEAQNYNLDHLITNIVDKKNLFFRIFSKLKIFFLGKDQSIDIFLQSKNIEIISHTGFLGKNSQINSFPMIYDAQELHLPQLFTLRQRFFRFLNIFLISKHSTRILVASDAVKQDLKKIYKKTQNKIEIIPQTVGVPDIKKLSDINNLKLKYKFKEKYFFLPNQYWVHKNHFLVLEALKYLNKNNKNFLVLSTGFKFDHRNKNYFKKIEKFIFDNNLNKNFLILGIVPYLDLMSLMYHSIALINPSKSEGWSNTVEQAKSYSKKILLSNIPVHLEQKPDRAIYFDPNDPIELAKCMELLEMEFDEKKEQDFYFKKFPILKQNKMKFAKKYESIILSSKGKE